MSRSSRLGVFGLAFAILIAIWWELGALAALAVALSVAGYLFVLAMRTAAAEIIRYEQDQRPDLRAFDR